MKQVNTSSASQLASSLQTIKQNNGKIILDWDNTIDIDDKNTIGEEAKTWLTAMATAGVDVYIVSGNGDNKGMQKKLTEMDPQHAEFWAKVTNKENGHYFNYGPGKKDPAYETITGGNYSKAVLFDDTTANIDDWQKLAGKDAHYYQPTNADGSGPVYARLNNVFGTLEEFASSSNGLSTQSDAGNDSSTQSDAGNDSNLNNVFSSSNDSSTPSNSNGSHHKDNHNKHHKHHKHHKHDKDDKDDKHDKKH
jgi:hypothetical protein